VKINQMDLFSARCTLNNENGTPGGTR
ncbi:uncharacterized protein METZ01_LOCUS402432, partial [marine metagenome]